MTWKRLMGAVGNVALINIVYSTCTVLLIVKLERRMRFREISRSFQQPDSMAWLDRNIVG